MNGKYISLNCSFLILPSLDVSYCDFTWFGGILLYGLEVLYCKVWRYLKHMVWRYLSVWFGGILLYGLEVSYCMVWRFLNSHCTVWYFIVILPALEVSYFMVFEGI